MNEKEERIEVFNYLKEKVFAKFPSLRITFPKMNPERKKMLALKWLKMRCKKDPDYIYTLPPSLLERLGIDLLEIDEDYKIKKLVNTINGNLRAYYKEEK